MEKKYKNRLTSFIDRYPFIIFVLILSFTIIFFIQFKDRFPLTFFSGNAVTVQQQNSNISDVENSILIISPAEDQVFNFVNKQEYVPIEIKTMEMEGIASGLELIINDKDTIKTFSSPPYRYNWHPDESGRYRLIANLVDIDNEILSSSYEIKFVVKLKYQDNLVAPETGFKITESTTKKADIGSMPTIKLEIYEGPAYSEGDDICYYRIKAKVTGNPDPVVSFSKDDSNGSWGSLKTQVNLTRSIPNYTLTAIAENSNGKASDSLTLNWGCKQ